jgi:glucokinase
MEAAGHRRVVVGDVGGTNARFALASISVAGEVRLEAVTPMPTRKHASFEDALSTWQAGLGEALPERAVFALAGPSGADTIRMTNLDWTVSARALEQRFGFARVTLANDFAAQARAMPALPDSAFEVLAPGAAQAGAPVVVLGPGTGLGMALLVPQDDGCWRVVPTEGGHQAFAPGEAREAAVLEVLRGELGYVSFETIVSGPGLARVYWALGRVDGAPTPLLDSYGHAGLAAFAPDTLKEAGGLVGSAATAGTDATAQDAARLMVQALATFAGNAVLGCGAKGGCVIAGGVADRQAALLTAPAFMERMASRGPMSGFFDGVPVRLSRDTMAALVGAALLHS